MIKSVIWSSLLDWPGAVCTTLFIGKCGWACPYCHNKQLFKNSVISYRKTIFPQLLERKQTVDHVVFSGGEPTEYSDLIRLIQELKKNGFKVGLHTNGSRLLDHLLPDLDFIAMDIKTVLSEDEHYGYIKSGIINGFKKEDQFNRVLKNIKLLIDNYYEKQIEFRTTLSSDCAPVSLIPHIAEDLANRHAPMWIIQNNTSERINKSMVQHIINMCDPRINIQLRNF